MVKMLIINGLTITLLKTCFCTAAVKHKKTGKNTRFFSAFYPHFRGKNSIFRAKLHAFAHFSARFMPTFLRLFSIFEINALSALISIASESCVWVKPAASLSAFNCAPSIIFASFRDDSPHGGDYRYPTKDHAA